MFFDNLLELEIVDILILKTILGKNPISTGVRINLKDNEWKIKQFVEKYNGKVMIIDMIKDVDLGIGYDMNSYQDINQLMML